MPSNKFRIELPEELADRLEEQSQDEGTSRQRIIQRIVEEHYSSAPALIDTLDRELQELQELEYLRRENKILYEHVELLRGVSLLIATYHEKKPSLLARTAATISGFIHFRKNEDTK
jgi:metal-responsive CopG/Arc/MetJ family transcriptional regulator